MPTAAGSEILLWSFPASGPYFVPGCGCRSAYDSR